ncbi:Dirigent protein 23 [Sesamum alatum]|uniref:Dirigent protein n=1 Tax=Sesamum alatum TaxID=300844 RepID=A0AAE1YW40_9LAMI|nr:Dirigent protein 23 [Sesamum alatum]
MARLDSVSVSIFLVLAITWPAAAQSQPNDDQVTWAKRVETGTEVITTLQFYFHDKVSGPNPTATRIAQAPQTNNSSTLFGMLIMIDDALTVGPDPSSKIVGRARGLYGSAGQTDFGLIMVLNYGFTDGIYDGSSFSLLSINPAAQPVREMAIVGGTGLFRLARGYAIARTYWLDATTGDAIVGYNVTIVTYV